MGALRDHLSRDSPAQFSHFSTALETPLVEGPDDVSSYLQLSQLLLHAYGEPIAATDAVREAERLKPPQAPPSQRRPGIVRPNSIVYAPLGISGLQETPVERREPICLSLPPYTALGVGSGEITQQILSNLLSSRPESEPYVVPRDD